ncbi:hypothetical protein [Cryobacterium sp. AP23]
MNSVVRTGRDTVAGYRLVRRIGSGRSSEIFLARDPDDAAGNPSVALKIFRPEADPGAIGRQVQAMLACPTAALPRLCDVATTPENRVCLVLEHLQGLGLDRLLDGRGTVAAGELVTVAATVTATLQALHDAGFSHPEVNASCVRFDGSGRPVLLGLGALAALPDGVAGVGMKRDAVVGLTGFLRSLLSYLDPGDAAAPSAGALLAEFETATTARPFPATLAALESALFAWAAAGEVRFAVHEPAREPDAPQAPQVPSLRVRALQVQAAPVNAVRSAGAPAAARRTGRLRGEVVRWVVHSGLGVAARAQGVRLQSVRQRAGAAARRLPGVRPLIVGLGVVSVLSVGGLAALSALPPAAGSGQPTATRSRAPGPTAPGEYPDTVRGTASAAPELAVLTGDDPAAAVLELLRQREACLAEGSVLCLDGVDQPDSVAMAADGYRIRQMQEEAVPSTTAPVPAGPRTAVVQERTGNAALVVLDGAGSDVNAQPASALVIKGEAGWRLRELFDY